MSVAASRLLGVPAGSVQPRTAAAGAARRAHGVGDGEAPSVVDVRGRTADEALDETVAALDRAALAGQPQLRIIHGHGTGALRRAIASLLDGHPHVARFLPAPPDQGGAGATLVELRQ